MSAVEGAGEALVGTVNIAFDAGTTNVVVSGIAGGAIAAVGAGSAGSGEADKALSLSLVVFEIGGAFGTVGAARTCLAPEGT